MSDDLNKLDYDVSYGADFQERKVEVIDVYEKKNDTSESRFEDDKYGWGRLGRCDFGREVQMSG